MGVADESNRRTGKDPATGLFVAGNTYGFQKGKVANPNGRPPKKSILKELDKNLGSEPRETLYKILDQATNGTAHFLKSSPMGKAIGRMSVTDIVEISKYLDEQANGKAKSRTELEGAVIVLSKDAENL